MFLKSLGNAQPGIYSLLYSSDEIAGISVAALGHVVSIVNADSQILSHISLLDGLNSCSFQGFAEVVELLVIVELGSVHQSSSPGEDRGDRVGGSLLSFLMLSIMPSDCSVSSFSLDSSVWSVEY
jgi:hypothetical protein